MVKSYKPVRVCPGETEEYRPPFRVGTLVPTNPVRPPRGGGGGGGGASASGYKSFEQAGRQASDQLVMMLVGRSSLIVLVLLLLVSQYWHLMGMSGRGWALKMWTAWSSMLLMVSCLNFHLYFHPKSGIT